MKKLIVIISCLSMAIAWQINAYTIVPADFVIDGVRYNILDKEAHTVQTSGFEGFFSNTVYIPAHVTNDGTEYTVIKFGGILHDSDGYIYDGNLYGNYDISDKNIPDIIYLPNTITETSIMLMESRLREFYMYDTAIENIGSGLFRGNDRLTAISLPHGLRNIGSEAFMDCQALTMIKHGFPEGLEEIGDKAFSGERSYPQDNYGPDINHIEEIILPNSLTSLGKSAFAYSKEAYQIVLSDNLKIIPEDAFYLCYNVRKLVIPNNVRQIGIEAFYGGNRLESLTIGKNMQYAPGGAITTGANLKEFYWLASEEAAKLFNYKSINKDSKVMVPPGKLEVFKNIDGWKDWFHDFQELPEIFFQFQQDYYNLDDIGESMALRYQVTSFIDNPNYEIEWTSSDPDGVVVENDKVKGLKSGVYTVTARLRDLSNHGEVIMEATCNVGVIDKVTPDTSSLEEINASDNTSALSDGIYNMQGIRMNVDNTSLPSGLYIKVKNNKAQKVIIH